MKTSHLSSRQRRIILRAGTHPSGRPWNSRELQGMGYGHHDVDHYLEATSWRGQHPFIAAIVFFGICCPIGFYLVLLGIGVVASI